MTPKQTPSLQTPCLNVISGLINGGLADGIDTIPPEDGAQENSGVGYKESDEFECLPIAPGVAHKILNDGPKQQLPSHAVYPMRRCQSVVIINEEQWKTTEYRAIKLSHSCPTFIDVSGLINVNDNNGSTSSNESMKKSDIELVGKYLYTMKKCSSSTVATQNGVSTTLDCGVKLIHVKPVQAS